jgi:hypothetical protein
MPSLDDLDPRYSTSCFFLHESIKKVYLFLKGGHQVYMIPKNMHFRVDKNICLYHEYILGKGIG